MDKPITLCDRCDHVMHCLLDYDGVACRKTRTIGPTNYEWLISKTPEEMAEWLEAHDFTVHGMLAKKKLLLDWLKSPADEEGEE